MTTATRTWHEDIIDAALPEFPAEGPPGTVHFVAVGLLMDSSYITTGRTYETRTAAQAQATRLSKAHDDCNAYVVARSQASAGPVYVVRCGGYQLHVRYPR